MQRIVVGVDGSDPAVAALGWAVRIGRGTGARIEVVTVTAEVPLAASLGGVWAVGEDATEQAQAAQQHTLDQVEHTGVDVVTSIQDGQPTAVLLGCAQGADLLVLGTHGYGALESALLGSVGRQAVTHAVCPTVLVPEAPGALGRFVVGVDGSEMALHALRWAADLARGVGASIEVVTAYQYTPVGIGSPWVAPIPSISDTELRDAARHVLDTAVERADAKDVVVERTITTGGAAMRLRERAQDADLLVVGSRGHGGFAGLLLGSVSRSCLTHAPRPVVVVPSH